MCGLLWSDWGWVNPFLGIGTIGKRSTRTRTTEQRQYRTVQSQDAQYADIMNFAEKFTIMAFNVSYTDINHQVDKVGNLMSDNMMCYYQEAFLDPKWVAFLSDNKAYVSYQADRPLDAWKTPMEPIIGSG